MKSLPDFSDEKSGRAKKKLSSALQGPGYMRRCVWPGDLRRTEPCSGEGDEWQGVLSAEDIRMESGRSSKYRTRRFRADAMRRYYVTSSDLHCSLANIQNTDIVFSITYCLKIGKQHAGSEDRLFAEELPENVRLPSHRTGIRRLQCEGWIPISTSTKMLDDILKDDDYYNNNK